MKHEYARALEQQMRWWNFHRTHGERLWSYIVSDHVAQHPNEGFAGPHRVGADGRVENEHYEITAGGRASLQVAGAYSGTILSEGDCFYIATNIQRLVLNAAKTLPDATFQRTMLPSPFGFMVFGEPLEMGRVRSDGKRYAGLPVEGLPEEFPIYASAMGWAVSPDIVAYKRQDSQIVSGPGVEFVFYTQAEMYGAKGYWPVAYFGIDEGSSWRDKLDDFERNVLVAQGEARSNSVAHEIAFVFALLLFMEQRILSARTERLDRATRRRSEREQLPREHMKVITLRRYAERAPSTDEEHSDIEWSCQWAVRGHWRKQKYPSQIDENGLTVIKPIWINPYTKGPEGKPFRDDDARRLFGVTR